MIPARMHLFLRMVLKVSRICGLAIVTLRRRPCLLVLVQDTCELLGRIGRVVIRGSLELRFGLTGHLLSLVDSVVLGQLRLSQVRRLVRASSHRLVITHWCLHKLRLDLGSHVVIRLDIAAVGH